MGHWKIYKNRCNINKPLRLENPRRQNIGFIPHKRKIFIFERSTLCSERCLLFNLPCELIRFAPVCTVDFSGISIENRRDMDDFAIISVVPMSERKTHFSIRMKRGMIVLPINNQLILSVVSLVHPD